jgi:hypothetical protein
MCVCISFHYMPMTGSKKAPRTRAYLRALARDRENNHRDMTRA